jgi:hypothetical protein
VNRELGLVKWAFGPVPGRPAWTVPAIQIGQPGALPTSDHLFGNRLAHLHPTGKVTFVVVYFLVDSPLCARANWRYLPDTDP